MPTWPTSITLTRTFSKKKKMPMDRSVEMLASIVSCLVPFGIFFQSAVAEELVVRPQPMAGPLDNPLKGWCPYTNAGEISQPYSMAFQYVSWRELEPRENDYRFDQWETSWDRKLGKDKHVIFRVFVDYPSKPSGLPDWLRDAGVKETPYTDHGGGMAPDYNDPRMLESMERLIAALGKRYNDHPRVAFIQIGLLGFWGEWHTYPRGELYASPATEQRIIDAYRKAFPDKSLMVRYARDYAGKQNWIGFHDDMFPEDTDNGKDWGFLAGVRREGRAENWKRAVVGGEMVPGKASQWLGDDYSTTLRMLNRAHFTWVGPYCPALTISKDKAFGERSDELIRKMGYEFQINEVKHTSRIAAREATRISLAGVNQGAAPFYYPWSVEWSLIDSSGKVVAIQKTDWDIRNWQPGKFLESMEITWDVPPGTYRLAFGIRDPWKDRPAIRFANDLPVQGGWAIISEINVSE